MKFKMEKITDLNHSNLMLKLFSLMLKSLQYHSKGNKLHLKSMFMLFFLYGVYVYGFDNTAKFQYFIILLYIILLIILKYNFISIIDF